VQPHEPPELGCVQGAAAVHVDLRNEHVEVIEANAVAQVPERGSQLRDADALGTVGIEAREDSLHLVELAPEEAVAALEEQQEVEKLLQVQLPVALKFHLLQDLCHHRLNGLIAQVPQHGLDLLGRDAAAAVPVVPCELLT